MLWSRQTSVTQDHNGTVCGDFGFWWNKHCSIYCHTLKHESVLISWRHLVTWRCFGLIALIKFPCLLSYLWHDLEQVFYHQHSHICKSGVKIRGEKQQIDTEISLFSYERFKEKHSNRVLKVYAPVDRVDSGQIIIITNTLFGQRIRNQLKHS